MSLHFPGFTETEMNKEETISFVTNEKKKGAIGKNAERGRETVFATKELNREKGSEHENSRGARKTAASGYPQPLVKGVRDHKVGKVNFEERKQQAVNARSHSGGHYAR